MLAERLWALGADAARLVANSRKGEMVARFAIPDPKLESRQRVGVLLRANGYFPLWIKRTGRGVPRKGSGLYIPAIELGVSHELDLGARIVGAMAAAEVWRINGYSCEVAAELS